MPLSPSRQRDMLRLMQTIRRFEERATDEAIIVEPMLPSGP